MQIFFFPCFILIFFTVFSKLSFSQENQFIYEQIVKDVLNDKPIDTEYTFYGSWLNYKAKKYEKSLDLLRMIDKESKVPKYFLELTSLIQLKQNNKETAKIIWENSPSNKELPWFSESPLDKTSLYLAYVVPGSGLIYEGEFLSGTIAFLLNGFLIYSIYSSIKNAEYGMALLYLFFEIPFYKGSINATMEVAEKNKGTEDKIEQLLWVSQAESLIRF